ncbi:hypothetical protein FHR99_000859 [Litorivivens lipolytica]|uniref:MOSC domain-containing protein n=1 Tax=Litorivivens lipolytica TaxID=1524264 RepID=A0A7W4Z4Y6_9GAMM|nr:MOSC N-terminal beta barrel domain-containing protein [Litorivivens lipolytica]MBB3046623.1 hypothetical protein [Litorivivens lipolytica]
MAQIAQLTYYPVKGLQGISLERVQLTENRGFPADRQFAIADESTPFDPSEPCHLKKQQLVVQMKYERLAQLKTGFDPLTTELTLSSNGSTSIFALSNSAGKSECEEHLTNFMQGLIKGKARLISAPGISYTDLSTPCISLINLNSVKALEKALGYPVDHRRFRANIYLDDLPAWEEETWLNKTLTINGTEFLVYKITDRCTAINVNPETAARDQTLQGLKRQFGHLNMGVYAKVIKGGEIREGDSIRLRQ